MPELTVITPVYNGENFIKETVDSVLALTKSFDIEYIVIDDGSIDKTHEILSSYKSSIRLISQENAGESDAVNTGIHEARSEFLLVVSADDPLFNPEIFLGFRDYFARNENLVALYPDWRMIDESGMVLKNVQVPDFSLDLLIGENQVLPGPGTIFRKSAAISIGGRRKKWRYVGDFDFWLRLSLHGDIEHRKGVLAQWRHHSGSTSIARRGPEMARERIEVISEFLDGAGKKISKKMASKSAANSYYAAARLCFFSPAVNGRKFFFKSVGIRKGWPETAKIHEALFMILFPASKKLFDLTRRLLGIIKS